MPDNAGSSITADCMEADGYRWSSTDWRPCDIHELNEFHTSSWGDPGIAKLRNALPGTVLQIVPPRIAMSWSIGAATRGQLYLRDEIVLIADRVYNSFVAGAPGVLLTGQPGSGKSFSLLFILLRCLALKQPVMFSSNGVTHLFTSAGVHVCKTAMLDYLCVPYKDDSASARIWSLINPNGRRVGPQAALISDIVFPVYAASSPHEDGYQDWLAKSTPRRFIMETWSLKDLQKCMPLHQSLRSITDAEVASCWEKSGKCPRDIQQYMESPIVYKERRNAALQAFNPQ